ncbi:MAG: archease [Candidatus Helarchaeota archaeon]
MAGFRFLDHISDVYIEATGETIEEAFTQAIYALFETMTDLGSIDPIQKHAIVIEAEDLKALLFELINEFLFLFDTKNLLFSKCDFKIEQEAGKYKLVGECWGEEFKAEKHPMRTEIKAPTYSLMEIEEHPKRIVLRFVIDI